LGNLLGETPIAGRNAEAVVDPGEIAPAEVSAGLDTLLRAGRPEELPLADAEKSNGNGKGTGDHTGPEKGAAPEPSPGPLFGASRPGSSPLERVRDQEIPFKFPRWMLFAADALLLGLVALVVFRSSGPLKAWEIAVCVAAVVLGASLSLAAILFTRDK
jgi:hypothetical protein